MSFSFLDYQSKKFLEKPKISDLVCAEKIYSLLNITEEIAEKENIRVIDEVAEDNLILVHYFNPGNNSEVPESVRNIRGTVINTRGNDPIILAQSFPYTTEIEEKELSEESLGDIDLDGCTITQAFEGTIIRVFKGPVTGKWYLSTHKRINGENSRWSGPTFGKIFEEMWGSPEEHKYEDYFDECACHIFLVSHPENKLACSYVSPKLRLVGKFLSPTGSFPDMISFFGIFITAGAGDINLSKPHPNVLVQTPVDVKDKNDLFEKVHSSDWKECSGMLVFNRMGGACYKLMNNQYSEKRNIRGNEPNLRMRYLQLLKGEDDTYKLDDLLELFPEKKEYFKEIESNYELIFSHLEKRYINRYRKGDESIIPQEEHFILEKTRRNYSPDLTLQENIKNQVKSSNGRHTNALIRYMLSEKKRLNKKEEEK